jgi:MFS family permease
MCFSPVTRTLALLCSAQFLVVLDVTIVAVALPAIRRSLGFPAEDLQWVVTAYTLAFGGLLIPAGRAADLVGRRRVFGTGVVVFGLASLGCGLAPSAAVLVALRTVQGAGAAMIAPAALALLTAAFPGSEARRRAVAWWTAAAAGGGASGWVLGGVLVEALGWPAVFLVNVPVCAAAAVLAARIVAESRGAGRHRPDLAGAVAVTVGLALLVHGLTRVEASGPADPLTAGSLAGALVALAGFALVERRAPDPILPRAALRRPGFLTAAGASVALTAATTAPMFLAILYQQELLGRSALATGLACAPFNLAVIAGSFLGPRGRARPVMGAGLAAIAAGAVLLATLSVDGGSTLHLLVAFAVMGAGLGAASVASTAAGTAALDAGDQGIASGVLNAAAQIGTVLGLSIFVPLAAAAEDPMTGYRWGFLGAAALAVAAASGVRPLSVR